jgi:hypothetical protein
VYSNLGLNLQKVLGQLQALDCINSVDIHCRVKCIIVKKFGVLLSAHYVRLKGQACKAIVVNCQLVCSLNHHLDVVIRLKVDLNQVEDALHIETLRFKSVVS